MRPIVLFPVLLVGLAAAASPSAPVPQERSEPLRLPAAFVANRGQLPPESLFRVDEGEVRLDFERGGFTLRRRDGLELRLAVEGAGDVRPEPQGAAGTRFHFLRGDDPERWLRDVPVYPGVRYPAVAPGVDLVVHAGSGRLEYDLRLAPFAPLEDVVLVCEGADELRLDAEGGLLMRRGPATLRQRAPLTYQLGPEGERRPLASRFRLLGGRRFGFEVDGRDAACALVVDPVLVYSRSLGGSASEVASGAASDAAGNLYVTGWSASDDFPLSQGAFDAERGGREVFVLKLDRDGRPVWASFLGGSYDDEGRSIAVGKDGTVTVVGRTRSSDFPTSRGAWRPNRGGLWDAFVARLSADGTQLVFGTFVGGSEEDEAEAVALHEGGSVTVAGTTRSRDFPCTSHAAKKQLEGSSDAFVVKLDASGAVPIYSTLLGGTREDRAAGLALDARGHAYVAGTTHSLDFPTTRNAFDELRGGGSDAFVCKLSFDGGALVWSSFLGGAGDDQARCLAVGSDGNVTVGGWTSSPDFPVTGPELAFGRHDAFVARLSGSGASLRWSRLVGGSQDDACEGLALDREGRVWLAGSTRSGDLRRHGEAEETLEDGEHALVACLEAEDGSPDFVDTLGGGGEGSLRAVAVLGRGRRVAVVGRAEHVLPSARGLLGGGQASSYDALVAVFSTGACAGEAEQELIGAGCGASLACGVPRVGSTLELRLRSAPPGSEGALLCSPPAEEAWKLEGWCQVPLDVTQLDLPRGLRTDSLGNAVIVVDVPGDPALCGASFVFQALILAPQQGPLAFGALSQPVLVTLGS